MTSQSANAVSKGLMGKLLSGGASSLLIKISSAGLSFVMFIIIARGMTTDGFALFGFGFSAATMMILVGSLGQRVAAVRFVPVYLERGASEDLRGFTRQGYVSVALGCSVLGAIFVLASNILDSLTGGSYALAVVFFTLALGLAEYQAFLLRGHGQIALALAPREVIWRLCVCLAFAFPALGLTAPIPAATGFALIAVMLVALTLAQALSHPATRPAELLSAAASYEKRPDWIASSKVFWGTSVLRAATPNIAMMAVGITLGALETGAFFAAFRMALVVSLVAVAAEMLAMPMLSAAHERGNTKDIKAISAFVALLTSLPAAAFFVFFLGWGDWTLQLYNSEFAFAKWALVIVAAGYLIQIASGPGPALLQMTGQEADFLRLALWINAATLIALVPLIWMFGIYGAALAIAAERALTGLFSIWFCRRRLQMDPSILGAMRSDLTLGRGSLKAALSPKSPS